MIPDTGDKIRNNNLKYYYTFELIPLNSSQNSLDFFEEKLSPTINNMDFFVYQKNGFYFVDVESNAFDGFNFEYQHIEYALQDLGIIVDYVSRTPYVDNSSLLYR